METETTANEVKGTDEELLTAFNAVPADRTFYMVKLFLSPDNEITGMSFYDGPVLKALDLPREKAAECTHTAELAQLGTQEAVNFAGNNAQMRQVARDFLKMFLTGEEDNNGEQDREGGPTTSTDTVHRDGKS